MKRTGLAVGAIAALLASIALLWDPEDPPSARQPVPDSRGEDSEALNEPDPTSARSEADVQAAFGTIQPLTTEPPSQGPSRGLLLVRGSVVDVLGARRPQVAIGLAGSSSGLLGRSGADGLFELSAAPGDCLAALDPELATLFQHCVRGASEARAVLVVADAIDVSGIVVDAQGAPVGGARVWLAAVPGGALAEFEALDNATLDMASDATDASGRFELSRLPTGPGIVLNAYEPRFGATRTAVPPSSTSELVIRLDPGDAFPRIVRGRVVFASNEPAPCAEVRLGENHRVRADESGRFELQVLADYEAASLIAFCRGYQPAVLPGFGRTLAESFGAPLEVQLVLGPEALGIEGYVEDERGVRLEGWRVALASGLEASLHQLPPVLVEELTAGSEGEIHTDDSGQFQIAGLRDQEYVLRAWDPDTLVLVETDPVRAGARDVSILVPVDRAWPTLRGRVVAPDGSPLGGVRVTPQVALRFALGRVAVARASVLTDVEGRFELEHVARSHLELACEGEAICMGLWSVPAGSDPLDLRVELERKRHLRLRFQSPEAREADRVGVWRDAERRGLLILPGGYPGPVAPIAGLEGQILATGELSRAIALYRGDVELRRVPLLLEEGVAVDVDI
jgi:hypothetical protein